MKSDVFIGMKINEKYENVDNYRFVERGSKKMKPRYRKVTMEDLFDEKEILIDEDEVNEEIKSNEKVAYISKSKTKDMGKAVDDLNKKKITPIVIDNVNESTYDEIEVYYVTDSKGSVKNISKTYKDADNFLEKSLKFNGKIGHKVVSKKDWDNEKITTSNIKTYKMNESMDGGCGCGGGKTSINESINVEKTKTGYLVLSKRLNNGDLFKRKYMDYTEKEAKVKFEIEFNKENKKTIKEGGCGCGGKKTIEEADIMSRRSLPGIGGAAPGVGMYSKTSKENGKINKAAYDESMKKVSKYNDIKLKPQMVDNGGTPKTAIGDNNTKKYGVENDEEYIEQLARSGMNNLDIDYDREPSEKFKERVKKSLDGDESISMKIANKRKDLQDKQSVYHTYYKDPKPMGQIVNNFKAFGKNKKVEESVSTIVEKIIAEAIKMKEGKKSKPDFLDFDKDGDKKEPMKKAVKDSKQGKGPLLLSKKKSSKNDNMDNKLSDDEFYDKYKGKSLGWNVPHNKKIDRMSKITGKKKNMKESEGWVTILNNSDLTGDIKNQPKVSRPSENIKISTGFSPINLGSLRVENAENLDKVVIPEDYRIEGHIFNIFDDNRNVKVRFEEGELIVLADKNKKMINEETSKIMKLMNYNYNTKPAAKSVMKEDVNATLKKMLNEVKGLTKGE